MAVDSGTSSPYGRVPFLSACFLSSLFFLSLSLAISLPLSLSLRCSFVPRDRIVSRLLFDCLSLLRTIFRDLFSRGRKRRRRTRRRSRRRRDRRRGETRGDVLGSLRRELCVRASACPPRVRGLRGFFGGEREVASRLGNTRDR